MNSWIGHRQIVTSPLQIFDFIWLISGQRLKNGLMCDRHNVFNLVSMIFCVLLDVLEIDLSGQLSNEVGMIVGIQSAGRHFASAL